MEIFSACFFLAGRVTSESVVYSFGTVLLDLLSGKHIPPSHVSLSNSQRILAEEFSGCFSLAIWPMQYCRSTKRICCLWISWSWQCHERFLLAGTWPDSWKEFSGADGLMLGGTFLKWWWNWARPLSFKVFTVWTSRKAKCQISCDFSLTSSERDSGTLLQWFLLGAHV